VTEHAYDYVVAGGGFFGSILACHLAERGARALVCERDGDLLQRASLVNQARVHNGYHYPRSILTALRSRVNFPRFVEEFAECIHSDFEAYYAVPRRYSKVTAAQFATFMRRIGAPIQPAPGKIKRLFDQNLIEDVFSVTEFAFDAVRLRQHCWNRLRERRVDVWLQTTVMQARGLGRGVELTVDRAGTLVRVPTARVLNCTYAETNGLVRRSGLEPLRLKHELTEMCLIEMPEPLRRIAVTVMCGPFFSVMPFPSRHLHTLSHVRYTPHCSWRDDDSTATSAYDLFERIAKVTHFPHMIRDASRYLPVLRDSQYVSSLWEIKSVLPQNEADDGRPILMFRHPDLDGLTSVMGGKIDNVYDAIAEYDAALQGVA
jgi:glycine/D-amino acid oxidase-like deaminating enzyme